MKKFVFTAVILLSVAILISCEKSASTSLEGRWNVISDSDIVSGGTTSYDVYNGSEGDYFVFQNEVLHTKEASQLDTFSYQIANNDSIHLTLTEALVYGVPQSGTYSFNGNHLRIHVRPNVNNPGFSYQRIINLKR